MSMNLDDVTAVAECLDDRIYLMAVSQLKFADLSCRSTEELIEVQKGVNYMMRVFDEHQRMMLPENWQCKVLAVKNDKPDAA